MYNRVEVQVHAFLFSALDAGSDDRFTLLPLSPPPPHIQKKKLLLPTRFRPKRLVLVKVERIKFATCPQESNRGRRYPDYSLLSGIYVVVNA
jgi:hypothetical protein